MKLYFIAGKARHGKDTLAEKMKSEYEKRGQKTCIVHISSHIKQLVREYFGWDGQDETKPRTLLQQLGTDIVRVQMNRPLFWITRTLEDLDILAHFFDVAILADVRLPQEIESIRAYDADAVSIHIVRADFESPLSAAEQQHATEVGLDHYDFTYDYEIVNTTLDQLERDAIQVIEEEGTNNEKNDKQ